MADDELYTDELRDRARAIIALYPEGKERSALLPLLHLVQSVEGRVTTRGVAFCAELLGLTKANVGAVATFYTMYKRRPTGDWLVSVCTNTMCGMMGGDKTFAALSEYLGVGNDETTTDGKITLEHAECLAACDYAPVMTVNYEFFNEVDEDKAIDIVKRLQDGARPQPDRGAPLCTLREIEFQLAGHADNRGEGVAGSAVGDPTLAGARLAAEHNISVEGFDPKTPIPSKQDGGK
jgi:NADH-quinone oxidoreductase subunit E